jgi:hypothetical protein
VQLLQLLLAQDDVLWDRVIEKRRVGLGRVGAEACKVLLLLALLGRWFAPDDA